MRTELNRGDAEARRGFLLLALAFGLSGCVTGGTAARRQTPVPPAPPKVTGKAAVAMAQRSKLTGPQAKAMVKQTQPVALFSPASGPGVPSIGIGGGIPDPPFGTLVYVFADQLASNTVAILARPTITGGEFAAATFGCVAQAQTVVASFSPPNPQYYFRSVNVTCDPGEGAFRAPAAAPLTEREAKVRLKWKGRVWKLAPLAGGMTAGGWVKLYRAVPE